MHVPGHSCNSAWTPCMLASCHKVMHSWQLTQTHSCGTHRGGSRIVIRTQAMNTDAAQSQHVAAFLGCRTDIQPWSKIAAAVYGHSPAPDMHTIVATQVSHVCQHQQKTHITALSSGQNPEQKPSQAPSTTWASTTAAKAATADLQPPQLAPPAEDRRLFDGTPMFFSSVLFPTLLAGATLTAEPPSSCFSWGCSSNICQVACWFNRPVSSGE